MFDHYTPATKMLVDEHKRELRQDATKYRLARQTSTSPLGRRIGVSVGRMLVALGQRLQGPYVLAVPCDAEVR